MANKFDRLLLGKLEVTKGTDPTPDQTNDAIRCISFDVAVTSTTIERSVVKETMGNMPHDIGKQSLTLTVEFEAKGSGTEGTAPEAGPIYLACGFVETLVPVTSATYSYTSDEAALKSSTFYCYKDGLLWKLIGAVGTLSQSYTIDDRVIYTATIQAPYLAPTAVGVLTSAVYDSTGPLIFSTATTMSDGVAIKVSSFAVEDGGTVTEHYVTNDHEFEIANRQPTVTFTKDSISTAAEWAGLTAQSDANVFAIVGGVGGNILTVSAPVCRRTEIAYSERENRDTLDLTYLCYESAGDDQVSLIFT